MAPYAGTRFFCIFIHFYINCSEGRKTKLPLLYRAKWPKLIMALFWNCISLFIGLLTSSRWIMLIWVGATPSVSHSALWSWILGTHLWANTGFTSFLGAFHIYAVYSFVRMISSKAPLDVTAWASQVFVLPHNGCILPLQWGLPNRTNTGLHCDSQTL